jgi:hypothetical protein
MSHDTRKIGLILLSVCSVARHPPPVGLCKQTWRISSAYPLPSSLGGDEPVEQVEVDLLAADRRDVPERGPETQQEQESIPGPMLWFFKIFSPKKLSKQMSFFTQNKAK